MLVLLRHGETTANADRRLLGHHDAPLTAKGVAQAAALAPGLGVVTELRSSPLARALDTASALRLEVPVEVDRRWTELDYGAWDLARLDEVPPQAWALWRRDPGFAPPGGESLSAVGARVREALVELFSAAGQRARREDGDVVVVSHVSPIKAAVAWALGQGDEVVWRLHLSTGSRTVIGYAQGSPVLHRYNEVPRLGAA